MRSRAAHTWRVNREQPRLVIETARGPASSEGERRLTQACQVLYIHEASLGTIEDMDDKEIRKLDIYTMAWQKVQQYLTQQKSRDG